MVQQIATIGVATKFLSKQFVNSKVSINAAFEQHKSTFARAFFL